MPCFAFAAVRGSERNGVIKFYYSSALTQKQ